MGLSQRAAFPFVLQMGVFPSSISYVKQKPKKVTGGGHFSEIALGKALAKEPVWRPVESDDMLSGER